MANRFANQYGSVRISYKTCGLAEYFYQRGQEEGFFLDLYFPFVSSINYKENNALLSNEKNRPVLRELKLRLL